MSISSEVLGNIALFRLHGHIDKQLAAELDEQFASALDDGAKNLVLDFSRATHIGSDALKVILAVFKRVRAQNGRVVHSGVSEEVRSLLNVAGFTFLLDEFESIEAAITNIRDLDLGARLN